MKQTIQQQLQVAMQQLSGSDTPKLDAEILLALVLKQSRTYLYAWPDKMLTDEEMAAFKAILARRANGEPIAYIRGEQEFWSLPFKVSADTLIPRPETELLIETALSYFSPHDPIKIADLGTGSGAIGLTIAVERPNWQVMVTDVSQKALAIARENAQRLGIKNVAFYVGNWCTALPNDRLDMIISNPPYIAQSDWATYAERLRFEPESALLAGMDGLDALRLISGTAAGYLKKGGWLLMEHGFDQGEAVRGLLFKAGFKGIRTLRDLSLQERVTLGQA